MDFHANHAAGSRGCRGALFLKCRLPEINAADYSALPERNHRVRRRSPGTASQACGTPGENRIDLQGKLAGETHGPKAKRGLRPVLCVEV
jgi:hypothetical protein